MPPNGVGGGGVHWNAETWRFPAVGFRAEDPPDRALRHKLPARGYDDQDWDVTYDELEPHYDRFEYLCGTSGQAGNIKGTIMEGGNPFEGPRSRPYPNPPQDQPFSHTLFAKAARDIGYKPFPQSSGNMSRPYQNPLGVRLGPCTYCGFCEWFGCGNYSKASPQTTILPALVRKSNFAARDNSGVTRINLDSSGKRATGETFVDAAGDEWEQPADLVLLSAYTIFNIQLLLMSGIGKAYDPAPNTGVIGRNFTHQTVSDVLRSCEVHLQSFHRLRRDRNVHRRVQRRQFRPWSAWVRRRRLVGQVQTNGRPIETTPFCRERRCGARMEEGGQGKLSERDQARHRRPWQHVQLL
ncbi:MULTISPECIES: GMC family oxidoreductase N-terminal domain-containing protein [unclassified Bradyrhizobium]|nr:MULTISPECIES: GMC family oxidoreductase N-terminal domain-containing protein [unclassified Bradyrhizobium]WGR70546.1 GMC family oxidoreductase N-terminal domain-containing protein [Bradyrhizobium sp. ISRA426]WGR75383.1 GMC family oxidoreductase N-terminal domain-containing protein [Bradyrhizobium sp. ISRA430]WGR85787.1 GMC family oxidoreductase N-terminal domain-containing protein [Bradyrhizobium sp. ISRA432]